MVGEPGRKGNVLFAQGADHLQGVEPVLQPDARAEANKQRQQRRQAGDVIDRYRQNGAIRGGEIQFLRIGVNRAEQVIVRDNRPFGSPVVPEVNIITAVSSRLTGTGWRVSGSGSEIACHSLSETARASGVFFSQSCTVASNSTTRGAIWPTSSSLSACLSLVLKGTTSMPRPSAAKGLRKKRDDSPRPADSDRLCAATRPGQAAPSLAVPAGENRGTDSADPQTPAPGHPGCGCAVSQGLVQILEVGGGAAHLSLLILRIDWK